MGFFEKWFGGGRIPEPKDDDSNVFSPEALRKQAEENAAKAQAKLQARARRKEDKFAAIVGEVSESIKRKEEKFIEAQRRKRDAEEAEKRRQAAAERFNAALQKEERTSAQIEELRRTIAARGERRKTDDPNALALRIVESQIAEVERDMAAAPNRKDELSVHLHALREEEKHIRSLIDRGSMPDLDRPTDEEIAP